MRNKPLAPNRSRGASGAMTRRNPPRFKADDLAYPIRVKFIVPQGGLQGVWGRMDAWLRAELDCDAWSWGPAHSTGCKQATAYYFRALADAQRFVSAFPELQLADGVVARSDREYGDGNFRAGPGWKA